MKKKMKGVLGIGLAFVLVASLMVFAIPVAADPAEEFEPEANEWTGYVRTAGSAGDWFIQGTLAAAELIGSIGPIAQGIDGDLYAYVGDDADTPKDLLKSEDGGRTWAASTSTTKSYNLVSGDPIVDMVCSSMDEDVLYVTDGKYVYKSVDGGDTFAKVAGESLEKVLMGACGEPVTGEPITCLDVGYDASDNPFVFIGVTCTYYNELCNGPPSVLYIEEMAYPSEWGDLELHCYGGGGYTPHSVGAAPDFADSKKTFAVVTGKAIVTGESVGTGGGTETVFNLTSFPVVPDSETIYLDAVETTAYTLDDASGEITFTTAPGAGVAITADYDYEAPVTGDPVGTGVPQITFTATLTNTPIVADSVSVTDGVETFSDNGDGTLTGSADGSGTIDYDTGALSVTFFAAPANGAAITADYNYGPATWVISTTGTPCVWTEVAELQYNNATATSFAITAASRIAFPDDYEDTNTLFVGVVDVGTDGGDVYSVTKPKALDLDVFGTTDATNIISLDIMGDTDGAELIAGAYDGTDVYYSTDGGWTWDASDKNPSGDTETSETYALWYGDSALAATTGDECAVSMSCGEEVGEYWNQISLIATDIDVMLDMDHAAGYLTGTSPIFIATECETLSSYSVFRYDQTYWERVYVSTLADYGDINWVQVSPDFDTTEAVFVANSGFDIFRSVDAGCSWTELRYSPTATIGAWVVIDEDTVLAGGSGGDAETIFKTTRHGARPWDEYTVTGAGDGVSFALSPDIADDGSILYGDDLSNAYISEDWGEEWDMIGLPSTAHYPTYVIFDPGYGTSGDEGEFVVYATTYTVIDRCTIDPDEKWSKQKWVEIYDELAMATGIAVAGDTALYVADVGSVEGGEEITVDVDGTIGIECAACCDSPDIDLSSEPVSTIGDTSFIDGELVTIIEYDLVCEVTSVVGGICTCTVYGDIAIEGYTSGAIGHIEIAKEVYIWTTSCSDCAVGDMSLGAAVSSFLTVDVTGAYAPELASGVLRSLNPMASKAADVVFERLTEGLVLGKTELSGLWLTTRSNVLWSLDSADTDVVWVWEDPLATLVIQETPSDGAQLTSTSKVTLEWEALDDADEYEISLYRYCPQCPDEKESVTVANSEDTCAIITGLEAGSKYYWKVRVAEGEPFLSKWSELWEFTTALGEVPYLCSPACGASDVILTTNFSWDAVSGASSYEIELATNEDFDPVIASGTATVNAWVASPELDYSTTYYWRVRAVKNGVPGAWSVCIFTTEAAPVVPPEPVAPVVIPPLPAPITPMWIWVIIGIGAALTIAVIVLIVTTRRVP